MCTFSIIIYVRWAYCWLFTSNTSLWYHHNLSYKALIAYNEQTGDVRSGQSDAPKGYQHWLFKFDGVHDTRRCGEKVAGRYSDNIIEVVRKILKLIFKLKTTISKRILKKQGTKKRSPVFWPLFPPKTASILLKTASSFFSPLTKFPGNVPCLVPWLCF